ncbi:MAG TPA: acyl-CoA dehydrogenase family protein [Candidatus Aminicenantes bacterium]|nr:acyl-CoA dehydrogenase family protein [Candidatus Aminicenantes bacterium]
MGGVAWKKLFLEEIRELAKQIAITKLSPRAMEIDQHRSFPWENIRTLGEAGFHGIGISGNSGGIGFGRVCFSSVVKELAQACASTALVYVSHSIVAKALELSGSEGVKKKWLPEKTRDRSLPATRSNHGS